MYENGSSYLASTKENNRNETNDDINYAFHSMTNKMIEPNKTNFEDKELEESYANLGHKNQKFKNNDLKQNLDSIDSPINAKYKFSIDMPNVSKQRLHEYLNDDLLKALEVSPSIPKINDEIQNKINQNMKENEEDNSYNISNNPNSLFGFSLYAPNNANNFGNQGNNIINNNIDAFQSINPNNNYFMSNSNNNIKNNKLNPDNNINNNLNSIINIDNSPIYIPIQMRNNEQNQSNNISVNKMNKKSKKNEAKNNQNKINKFDKKNNKDGKIKRNFEVRLGDWNCAKCNNLNFSFRSKCNRCGLPKEISIQQFSEMFNGTNIQNINYEMMDYINPNLIYINNNEMNLKKE